MNKSERNYFVEHRARALATVFLTGRNNVEVFSVEQLGGLDQLGRIVLDEANMEMLFGVILKATAESLPDEESASQYLNAGNHSRKLTPGYPFPVVVLLFSMQGDNGYYSWQVQPYLPPGKPPYLIKKDHFACERANKAALDKILDSIGAWYKRFHQHFIRVS